jgi:hypothetical protein
LILCTYYVANKKENTFSPMQVKNNPLDGETEHAFFMAQCTERSQTVTKTF